MLLRGRRVGRAWNGVQLLGKRDLRRADRRGPVSQGRFGRAAAFMDNGAAGARRAHRGRSDSFEDKLEGQLRG